MSSTVCTLCGKTLSSKYSLQTHLRGVHRYTADGEPVEELKCGSKRCLFTTCYPQDYRRHVDKCLYVEMDRMSDQYERIISELRNEVRKHSAPLNDTTILTDEETFVRTFAPDNIVAVASTHFKPYFWLGQRGLAVFLVDYLIRQPDGKMCMVFDKSLQTFECTNRSLSEFTLISLIEQPLRKVIDQVYAEYMNECKECNDAEKVETVKKVYQNLSGYSEFIQELSLRIQK